MNWMLAPHPQALESYPVPLPMPHSLVAYNAVSALRLKNTCLLLLFSSFFMFDHLSVWLWYVIYIYCIFLLSIPGKIFTGCAEAYWLIMLFIYLCSKGQFTSISHSFNTLNKSVESFPWNPFLLLCLLTL